MIYVSDSFAHRVRKIEAGLIETVAGTGEPAYAGDGGPGVAAALHWPTALALDPSGNLYIADTFNHVVRRLDVNGTITTVAGTGVEGFSGDGADARSAQLDQPFGLAVDGEGALYIGDRRNFRVRKVDGDGVITTIVGVGTEGFGREGPAIDSPLGYTARIALDGDGLLIAAQSSAMVWRARLR